MAQCKLNYRNAIIVTAPAKNLVYCANGAISGLDRATLILDHFALKSPIPDQSPGKSDHLVTLYVK